MQCNVGSKERIARIGLGLLAGGVAVSGSVSGWVQGILGVVGLAGLATGITRYCPVNQMVGYNGCAADEKAPRVLKKTG